MIIFFKQQHTPPFAFFLFFILFFFFVLLSPLLFFFVRSAVSSRSSPIPPSASSTSNAQTFLINSTTRSVGRIYRLFWLTEPHLASLAAVLFSYYLKRQYGKFASGFLVLYLSNISQYPSLTNGGIVRHTMGTEGPRSSGSIKWYIRTRLWYYSGRPWRASHQSVALPDHARFLGAAVSTGMSGLFAHTGRGKQSILLDLLKPRGQDILKRLIKRCDVILLSNLSKALIEKLRVSYKDASRINPRVIYFENVFVSSKNVKSYEPVLQAASGLASMMSNRLVPEAFCCKIGSITATQAICSAIYARNKGAGAIHSMDP